MELRFIDKGTTLNLEIIDKESLVFSERKMDGKFYGLKSQTMFYITCDELYVRYEEQNEPLNVQVTFSNGSDTFSFLTRTNGVSSDSKGTKLIVLAAVTPMEKIERRVFPRVDISIPVSVFRVKESGAGNINEFLFHGITNDISSTGLCVLTDFAISPEHGERFVTQLTIGGLVYSVSADLVRRGNSPQARAYKHDYGFWFDFSDNPGQKNSLTLAMVKYAARL